MRKSFIGFSGQKAGLLLVLLLGVVARLNGAGGEYNLHWRTGANERDTELLTFTSNSPGPFYAFKNGSIILPGEITNTTPVTFEEGYHGNDPVRYWEVKDFSQPPVTPVVWSDYFTDGYCIGCNEHVDGGPAFHLARTIVVDGPHPVVPPNTKCTDTKLGGTQQSCSGCSNPATPQAKPAMAQYSVHAMLVSLNIEDTPLRYSPPRGQPIDFTVTYNERDSQQHSIFSYSNLGPKWTFNWLSYIVDDPTTQRELTTVYVPGGGAEIHRFQSGSFQPDTQSHSFLVRPPTNPNRYEKWFPDGSYQIFDLSNGIPTYPRRLFMTSMIDSAGNETRIEYDSNFRIKKIKALCVQGGICHQETTLEYNEPDPLKISRVRDPFGVRYAEFHYDGNGRLDTITDEIGIQSVFGYQGTTDTIESITTPYGTTTFYREIDGANRFIEATDPMGGKERVEYREQAQISDQEPSNLVPTGMTAANVDLHLRNTFYWSKKANGNYAYSNARITHWLLTAEDTTSGIVASEKMPLEHRVWYAYEGQLDLNHEGTNASPSQVARVLGPPSYTTQLYQYEYNNVFGKTTKVTDPRLRVTTYFYDPANHIDLLEVRQKVGTSYELIHEFRNYILHRPQEEYDAAGNQTLYQYNSLGQPLSSRNARHETTTYTYDRDDDGNSETDGYLTQIDAPSGVTIFGYDAFKRIATVTNDEDDYTVTTEYDHLDRKTKVSYPDLTYEQYEYTDAPPQGPPYMLLDLTRSRDRLGRWTYRHYNGNRQMISITEPGWASQGEPPRTTLYGWCSCGSLETITDPDGAPHITTFHTDIQGRVYQKEFADGTTIDYLFEGQSAPNTPGATSRIESMTDALGRRTNYKYFPDNDIEQLSYTDTANNPLLPPTPSVNYTYELDYHRVETMSDGTGTTVYAYYSAGVQGAGRLESIDGPLNNDTITYTYDDLGRVHDRAINGNTNIEMVDYDPQGRLTSNDNLLGHFGREYYGGTPRLHFLYYPTQQKATYSYFGNDHDRRLQTIHYEWGSGVNVSQFDYVPDAEGQILSWNKLLGTTSSGLWFTYDDAQQLRIARNSENQNTTTKQLNYDYDPAGNRTFDRNSNPNPPPWFDVSNTYEVNRLNQVESLTVGGMIVPEGSQEFLYDAVGNLIDDGAGKLFEWDAANRLVAIDYIATGNRTEFAYDGLGRRVKITEYGPGVTAEIEPTDGNYSTFTAGKFQLSAGLYTITLQGLNFNGGDNTMLVDSVKLNSLLLSNGSFETPPNIVDYEVAPQNASWSFLGTAGIAANNGFYTDHNPPAPEGRRCPELS